MEKDSYHHKDIKNRLLSLAIDKLEDIGIDKLSIRQLARELGISKNAPYRHFKSKAELLAAVANFGFLKLTDMMSDLENDDNDFKDNLEHMGNGYIEFGRLFPSIYKIMFIMTSKEVFFKRYNDNATKAFMVLLDHITLGINSGVLNNKDPYQTALSVWAYIHGCATFHIDKIGIPFNLNKGSGDIFNIDILMERL